MEFEITSALKRKKALKLFHILRAYLDLERANEMLKSLEMNPPQKPILPFLSQIRAGNG